MNRQIVDKILDQFIDDPADPKDQARAAMFKGVMDSLERNPVKAYVSVAVGLERSDEIERLRLGCPAGVLPHRMILHRRR